MATPCGVATHRLETAELDQNQSIKRDLNSPLLRLGFDAVSPELEPHVWTGHAAVVTVLEGDEPVPPRVQSGVTDQSLHQGTPLTLPRHIVL